MTKKEINKAFHDWLISAEFKPDREKIEEFRTSFAALQEADRKKQLETFVAEGGAEEDFEYRRDQEDQRFSELLDIYHDKRQKAEKKKKEELENNYAEKKSLLEELQKLIQDEENIAKAYKRFNAIRQKWREIGPVPQGKTRDLQAEFSRLMELFYYNINIYRELKINDLKKNLELKREVIEKIKKLKDEQSISQLDFLIHQYLHEWDEIGPTFREEWEKIRDEFKEAVSVVFERIREHRKAVKEEHERNHQKKLALVERVNELAQAEMNDFKEVQRLTNQVIEAQKAWKHIGYAGRGKNDSVWKKFRKAVDAYFEKRNQFLEKNNSELSEVREVKLKLIEEAKKWHAATENLDEAANKLKALQRQWKEAGKLLPQEEYKLFKEFRSYCDQFFKRRKKEAEEAAKQAKENLIKKQEMLVEFKKQLEESIKEKGEALIEEWRQRWNSLSDAADRLSDKADRSFEKLVTEAYKKLGVSEDELREKKFEARLGILTGKDNATEALEHERGFVQKKIEEAKSQLLQLENKLDFFTFSDESNPLKRDLLQRIESAKAELEEWKNKRKQLDLAIRNVGRESEKAETSEEGSSDAAENQVEERQEP
ncbi:MAG: DUF349 domain-containing protein [Salibacteraceae bacterium]